MGGSVILRYRLLYLVKDISITMWVEVREINEVKKTGVYFPNDFCFLFLCGKY
jgi:hypothetical protein